MRSPGVDTIPQLSALLCLLCGGVGAKPAVEDGENLDDILTIEGMSQDNDGNLFLNGSLVKSIKSVGGGQDFQLPQAYKEAYDRQPLLDMNKETDAGLDQLNVVEKITPIKSITDLKSVREIKNITPVKSIEEIVSLKEIKSIEEIKEKIAREFIRKHGLKNIIAEGGGSVMPYGDGDIKMESSAEDNIGKMDIIEEELESLEEKIERDEVICENTRETIETMKSKLSALEKVKENHCTLKETEITAYEVLKDELSNAKDYGFEIVDDPAIDSVEATEVLSKTPLQSVQEIKSMEPVKSIQEIKSMEPVKSVQEIKNLYELTEKQADQLRDMVAAKHRARRF